MPKAGRLARAQSTHPRCEGCEADWSLGIGRAQGRLLYGLHGQIDGAGHWGAGARQEDKPAAVHGFEHGLRAAYPRKGKHTGTDIGRDRIARQADHRQAIPIP